MTQLAAVLDKVASEAQKYSLLRAVLSLLTAPFYVVGFAVGLVWFVVAWAWAAVVVGFRGGITPRSPARRASD